MPNFIGRLALIDGQVLELKKKWLQDDPMPIGIIDVLPEVSEQVSDDEIERTSERCVVWLMPEPLAEAFYGFYFHVYGAIKSRPTEIKRIWADAQKTMQGLIDRFNKEKVIRRYVPMPMSTVKFYEEVLELEEAYADIHTFFAEKINLLEDDDEEEPNKLPTNGPVTSANPG